MKIEIIFNQPVNGFWDGGKKSGGIFEGTAFPMRGDKCDGKVKFGCYALNFFFSVKQGKTEKDTIESAKRWLKRHCKVPFKFVN